MTNQLRSDYYVYIHRRKDNNKIFYVGKGSRNRFKSTNRHNCEWHRVVQEAGGFIPEILFGNLTEQESFDIEKQYITSPPDNFELINKSWVKPIKEINIEEISKCFYYDETSPSCLRYKVNEESLAIQKRRGKKDGDPAGYMDSGYWRLKINKNEAYLVHRLIWTLVFGKIPDDLVVDHVDMDKSNNKISNLRAVTPAVNSRNRLFVHFGGVTKQHARGVPYYQSSWVELDGTPRTRCFSIKLLGEDEALRLAKESRRVEIERLNIEGANYFIN